MEDKRTARRLRKEEANALIDAELDQAYNQNHKELLLAAPIPTCSQEIFSLTRDELAGVCLVIRWEHDGITPTRTLSASTEASVLVAIMAWTEFRNRLGTFHIHRVSFSALLVQQYCEQYSPPK